MNEFQALLTFLGILVTADGDLLDKYTRASGNLYHGRYTRDIHEPQLLVPRKVFEDGSFNTYSLPNFYDRQEVSERRKRSVKEGEEQSEIDKLHLILPFNGIEHHVELSPYHEFISPDMVIETRGSGLSKNLNDAVRFKRAPDRQCHYRGIIRGHHGSRAALSLCDGVAGYVQTDHGRYFIEPLNEVEPEADGQHVHVAYRRDAPHEKKGSQDGAPKRHCTTGDDWEAAWAEQLAERQKRLMEDNSIGTKRGTPVSYGTHSIHRYIEIGLVADRRFLDYYNNTDYEQYLLTVMNMVSDFYHDKSVGNQIDVVVVRMIYLEKEKEEIDLLISPAAENTLASFAKWAEKMNPKDSTHPNHHDIGVLVTRYDICSEGTNCDLMGLAYVGVACNPARAACINEDNGLLLGIVVAHEVGHVMGCSHDEPAVSGCQSKDTDGSYFIMSPIVFIYTIRWSICSRKFITTFLESGLGECLNDDPKNPSDKFRYPNMLPGAMYDTEAQCHMMIPYSKWCRKNTQNPCEYLWCKINATSCFSRGAPMADGTKCGENKWCIHKQCVDIGARPAAVNGGWGKWGPAGTCTRTCGGGIKIAERECDNPPPANGGRYCVGERKKVTTCNTTPCDPTKPSFYAYQCSLYNKRKVLTDGAIHVWSPYYSPTVDPCALYCVNEKRTFVKLSSSTNDSTPCKPGTNNMCIGGVCRRVGCDWIMDSEAVEDKCGICKGDGTKCKPVEGYFNTSIVTSRYMKIVTVPKGARSIHAEEMAGHRNTLAVRYEKNDVYCLNGNMTEERNGDYPCAGTIIIYQHPEPNREEIFIKRPISEDIRIEYVFLDPHVNPGVRYVYYVTSTDPSYTPKYIWDFMEWSDCTAKCGGGTMVSEASCIEENAGKVSPSFCSDTPRPEPKSRICNAEPCPAKWRVSQWSKCSACDGNKGTKHRKVQCVRPAARAGEDDVQANYNACKGRVPKQQEECIGQRPCKKTCPKKTRDAKKDVPTEKRSISPTKQSKLIDKFVDLSLARYLEKSRGDPSIDANEFERTGDLAEFRQLLRDWSVADMDKKKRGTCEKERTTPKPGSIIKDSIPVESVVLIEAPFVDEGLQANLSDKAFQQSGDVVGIGIDTSRQKVYKGSKAVEMIEQLSGHGETTPATRTSSRNDNSARIVDQ